MFFVDHEFKFKSTSLLLCGMRSTVTGSEGLRAGPLRIAVRTICVVVGGGGGMWKGGLDQVLFQRPFVSETIVLAWFLKLW